MTRRTVLITAFLLAIPAFASESVARSITIYRDKFGVPHVYAPTDAAASFGFAYAQAEDNFWQIEDSYIRGVGRAAEVYGEKALADDLVVRALEIPKYARQEYERLSPKAKAVADGYIAGLNWYLAKNPGTKPRLITKFEPWMAFAYSRYSVYVNFLFRQTGLRAEEMKDAAQAQGSNMWAVMPAKSTAGRAMLFINPHQPFFGLGQWWEGHVVSKEGWNLSGATFFGSAFPTLGHNENLGWSHTVNKPDNFDIWEETFDKPGDRLAYKYGNEYRRATEWSETVKVNGTAKTYRFRKTHHGPIVAVRNGKPMAIRFARLEEGGAFEQWYEMGKARNFAEFKKALSRTAVPLFNTMYADREGNIYYVHSGAVPRRATRYDWSKPVNGSDPEAEWQGYHTLEELPQVFNPKSGFVQNCNSTPFTTTIGPDNPDESKYPRYMWGDPETGRARISRRILANKPKFSFEEWERAAFDTTAIEAETAIPLLGAAYEELRKKDPARAAKLAGPMEELREWDHVGRFDSKAMTLFTLYFSKRVRQARQYPEAIGALESVIADLEKGYGTWQVPWGEINRIQRRHTSGEEPFRDAEESYPVAGGPGDIGIVFNFYARPEAGQKRIYGVAGHSFVSVVEFGPQVRAKSLLQFGQSADPKSPHYMDQGKLYSESKFKPAWFTAAEVKANSPKAYKPGL
jgi:acyl-homoserine-lactone acylase